MTIDFFSDVPPPPTAAAGILAGEFLNIHTASERAGVPYHTFRRRVARERLDTFKRGGLRYIRAADLTTPGLYVR